jgi:hypothetical protein
MLVYWTVGYRVGLQAVVGGLYAGGWECRLVNGTAGWWVEL